MAHDSQSTDGLDPGERDPLARLLQRAGKRAAPPPDMVERVRVQVHAAWQQELALRRRNRWLAIAASVFTLAIGGVLALQLRSPLAPVMVASIERSAPGLAVYPASQKDGEGISMPVAGTRISAGDRLETGSGSGAVLRAPDADGSLSLRLAPDTSVVWQTPDRVKLLSGQIYVDTGSSSSAGGTALAIEAGGALIQHVGTRFLTALSAERLDVKVRDGTVRMEAPGEVALLEQGEHGQLQLGGSGTARVERLRVGSAGDDWSWVDALAPRLAIENQTLLAVLHRVAHEGGFVLRFESEELEREASAAVLHGPELTMPPHQALDAILATTAFVADRLAGGAELLVRRR